MLELKKKPKNPVIIEGFPGFGLVGTIASEFLINHLKCEKIGRCYFEDLAPTIAIHGGNVIDPVSIYYNKRFNLVIIHSVSGANGIEWKAADHVKDVAKQLSAKEIICLEGVGSAGMQPPEKEDNADAFYYSSSPKSAKKLKELKIEELKEGIIMGVTSALLIKSGIPVTCLFSETHSNLPDSKAAAKIIEVLDKYLGLDVDYKPLMKQAEKFESKLKSILEKGMQAQAIKDQKQMNYVQ